ncbi:HNH endonuclease signature motif containing protein [Arthrobacter sp. AQ5-05]|uniref:HNH endonuclease signature motif containing protein n=1 Tax=Arthrobacter sp. AQ5-05 TaxID=2184581 RepID=UPI0015EBA622|nr:HNH endonuclease signature motif containing protein [Arthrobacter sp. AQ5-05]
MVPKTCSVDECHGQHLAKGLCGKHYQRMKAKGTVHLKTWQQRFWEMVDVRGPADCWNWKSPSRNGNYGTFGHYRNGKRAMIGVHRVSWEIHNAPIPVGMEIDHRCHNTLCVNPSHLRMATGKQNSENQRGLRGNNTSGVRGVRWEARRNSWRAQITHNRRVVYVGNYADIREAEKAVIAKRNELFTHNDIDRMAA